MPNENQTKNIRIAQQELLILKRSLTIATSVSLVAGLFFVKAQRQTPPATPENLAPVGMQHTVIGKRPNQSSLKDRDDDDKDDDSDDDRDDD